MGSAPTASELKLEGVKVEYCSTVHVANNQTRQKSEDVIIQVAIDTGSLTPRPRPAFSVLLFAVRKSGESLVVSFLT